ncbi:hypothetical protein WJX81_001147 [Elliptochloris bilobata]|uniref:Protein kinase domain-containing protein n=1 Tax=Elliptochloris bilobata TaxID=381761 RepID=A0AAW1QZI7_9CHLO
MASSLLSPSSEGSLSQAEEKVRLRVSSGGAFVLANGQWKLSGAESYLESVSPSCTYADLCWRLGEKHGATSIRYVLPGEKLDPDSLITVADDQDVQEMFEEFFRALKVPGTPVKTFRLRVVLFPAAEEPMTPEELADAQHFFSTSSAERVVRTRGMVSRTSGTEVVASSFGSNASSASAGTAGHRFPGAPHSEQAAAAEDAVKEMHWQEAQAAKEGSRRSGAVGALFDFNDSARSLAVARRGLQGAGSDGACRFLYQTQDPWYAALEEGAAAALAQATLLGPGKRQHLDALLPRGSAGGRAVAVAPATAGGGGVRLPSHISAFGDGSDGNGELGDACGRVAGLAGLVSHALEGVEPSPREGTPPGTLAVAMSTEPGDLLRGGSGCPLTDRVPSGGTNPLYCNVHRVPKDEVKVLGRIGEGAFGEVSLATCAIFGKVAVKWLKPGKVERHSASFWREADMLGSLNHPSVLRFYGAVVAARDDPAVIGIMTEFMRGGSLAQLLRSGINFLPLRERAELALHAVNGLAYLHEMKIVHFDLKPDNLLLEAPLVPGAGLGVPSVKVADFGLSKHKRKSYVSGVRDLRGTLPYMAPELVSDPDHVSEKADVWSLGMVLWEMLCLETPFQALTPQQIIAGLMVGNLAPEVPAWCEPEWRGLMEACWEVSPAGRPSFRQLAVQLEKILEAAP